MMGDSTGGENDKQDAASSLPEEPAGHFPTTVSFRQDNSDKTKVYLILSFKGLEISRGILGMGKKLENGDILNQADIFKPKQVHLLLKVNIDGTEKCYEYKKSLPKQIVPEKSTLEFEKGNKFKLTLKKSKGDVSDWTVFQDHFSHPD